MKEKHHYDQLREALAQVQKDAEERIKKVIRETVDAHEDAWYGLLMNGTDGASDKSLKTLGYARAYPADRL